MATLCSWAAPAPTVILSRTNHSRRLPCGRHVGAKPAPYITSTRHKRFHHVSRNAKLSKLNGLLTALIDRMTPGGRSTQPPTPVHHSTDGSTSNRHRKPWGSWQLSGPQHTHRSANNHAITQAAKGLSGVFPPRHAPISRRPCNHQQPRGSWHLPASTH